MDDILSFVQGAPFLVNYATSGTSIILYSHPLCQGNFPPPGREQADRSHKRHQAEFRSGQTRPGLRAPSSMERISMIAINLNLAVRRETQLAVPHYHHSS